ncbi:DUF2515 family protein [Neobacillus sp. D3-1R]|uniref:DUF2515 family protein n=1 Tax=Neobacillus sp. D3-1R TaxID=3445778 RepID=UPI003FA03613
MFKYNTFDLNIVQEIEVRTSKKNKDNISRTEAYFQYFKRHPDIRWSFLASMVSRNGGYNMCDLEGVYFPPILEPAFRNWLFLTYERANWLIFYDVYPQLLIYEYSTNLNRPLFHLLEFFGVSNFIQREWYLYWEQRNQQRLTTSLIINEQNVIQKPVIKHHLYNKKVFHSVAFQLEDWFHFSCVLFPTCRGEVYGASVNGFRNLSKRINLGKRLADILFQPDLFPAFFDFAEKQTHTGSRFDYEKYFTTKHSRKTPFLRTTFPVIDHHIHQKDDWSLNKRIPRSWLDTKIHHRHPIHLTNWYRKKQDQIKALSAIQQLIK